MKRILILTCLTYNLFSAVDNSQHLLEQTISNILGSSQTIEELNANIAKLELSGDKKLKQIVNDSALQIVSAYLQHKFPGEFDSADFFADAKNKGPLYYQYLEPLIFITKNLNLGALDKLLIASHIDTNINMNQLDDDYNIIYLLKHIKEAHEEDVKIGLEKRLLFLLKIGFVNWKSAEYIKHTALIWASKNGHKAIVEFLIKAGANVNAKANNGYTALIFASANGHKDIVELLIKAGAIVNDKSSFGNTALMLASEDGYKDIVELLIKANANINEKNHVKDTALLKATRYGTKDIVELLIKSGANANDKNDNGNTALSNASIRNKEMVELLIKAGANVNDKDNNESKALILACQKGNKDIVELLIKANANINQKDNAGQTALIYASIYGWDDIVELLIKSGANLNDKNKFGNSALKYAYQYGYKKIIELLKQHGAV